MNVKKIQILAIAGIFLSTIIIGIGAFYLACISTGAYKTNEKSSQTSVITVKNAFVDSQATASADRPAAKNTGITAIAQTEKAGSVKNPSKFARIEIDPANLVIETKEGQKAVATFQITNTGTQDNYINMYKSDPQISSEEADKQLKELLAYKQGILAKQEENKDLKKASLFTGTPWLLMSPNYKILKPRESAVIKVIADAARTEPGEYNVFLFLTGTSLQESRIIPVSARIESSPKIKVSKVIIDDGFSKSTKGNSNHIATAQEKVAVTISLTNEGKAPAKDITARINHNDKEITILGSSTINIPYIGPGEKTSIKFTAKIPPASNSKIPPAIEIITSDSEGTQWSDNFYLGDPKNIEYPLGLVTK